MTIHIRTKICLLVFSFLFLCFHIQDMMELSNMVSNTKETTLASATTSTTIMKIDWPLDHWVREAYRTTSSVWFDILIGRVISHLSVVRGPQQMRRTTPLTTQNKWFLHTLIQWSWTISALVMDLMMWMRNHFPNVITNHQEWCWMFSNIWKI